MPFVTIQKNYSTWRDSILGRLFVDYPYACIAIILNILMSRLFFNETWVLQGRLTIPIVFSILVTIYLRVRSKTWNYAILLSTINIALMLFWTGNAIPAEQSVGPFELIIVIIISVICPLVVLYIYRERFYAIASLLSFMHTLLAIYMVILNLSLILFAFAYLISSAFLTLLILRARFITRDYKSNKQSYAFPIFIIYCFTCFLFITIELMPPTKFKLLHDYKLLELKDKISDIFSTANEDAGTNDTKVINCGGSFWPPLIFRGGVFKTPNTTFVTPGPGSTLSNCWLHTLTNVISIRTALNQDIVEAAQDNPSKILRWAKGAKIINLERELCVPRHYFDVKTLPDGSAFAMPYTSSRSTPIISSTLVKSPLYKMLYEGDRVLTQFISDQTVQPHAWKRDSSKSQFMARGLYYIPAELKLKVFEEVPDPIWSANFVDENYKEIELHWNNTRQLSTENEKTYVNCLEELNDKYS